MDEIQTFFQAQAFRRVVFQDGSAWTRSQGYPILRDTSTVSNAHQGPIPSVSNRQASTTLGKQPRYLSLRSTRRNGYER
jgi:hypothetical protein